MRHVFLKLLHNKHIIRRISDIRKCGLMKRVAILSDTHGVLREEVMRVLENIDCIVVESWKLWKTSIWL